MRRMEVISSGLASRMGLKIRHKCHLVHLAPQRGTGPAEACPRTLPGQKPILHLRWSHRIRWLVKLVSPIPTGFAEQPSVLQHCTALRFVRVGWDPDRELAPCETGGFPAVMAESQIHATASFASWILPLGCQARYDSTSAGSRPSRITDVPHRSPERRRIRIGGDAFAFT
jgi:hypothetical protein